MGRRTLLLLAAVLVAALGTTMVFIYANGANDRALADQAPVSVLVAKAPIAAGTSVAAASKDGAFELKTLAADARVPGALADASSIKDEVALAPVFPGQQILPAMFGKQGQTSGLAIPAGKVAISVQLGDPARVAGFVAPGAEVSVMDTTKEFTRVLLPRVTVIAVGPTTTTQQTTTDHSGASNTEQLPRAILTLAVSQVEAQKVVYAQSTGDLYFALLAKDSQVGPGAPVNDANLFG